MKRIIWLASYPRSGNTWLRKLLSGVLLDREVGINNLDFAPTISHRNLMEAALGYSTDSLSCEELELLRPKFHRYLAASAEEDLFFKVHDACFRNSDGEELFPAEISKIAVYVVRNPLDVCVSNTFFRGDRDFERTVDTMCDPSAALSDSKKRCRDQLRQPLLTWSEHVRSWKNNSDLDVKVLRYEDMLSDTKACFSILLKELGYEFDEARIERAVAAASFGVLQAQESCEGFREKPHEAQNFFRSGKNGDWREYLSDKQVDRLTSYHSTVMKELGYL